MTKMSKKLLSMILAGAMCVSLTACGGSESNSSNGDSAGSSGDGYKISMIMKTTAAEYWQIVQAGGEAYAKDHPDVVSEVSVKGPPSETSYEEQLNMLQTDLAQDYDGYLISPLQADSVADQIASTDKPVVAFDTDVDSEKCLSFVGTGNKEAAKMGGEAAVEAAKAAGWTEIKCIEIAGVEGDSTNTARMEGYREGVNGAGGEFLDDEVQYANADPDKAVSAMEAIMGKYPEGVAIICANNDDMAAAAAQAAKSNSAYSKTIFLGFNGDKGGCQAILEGNLTMSVAQKNYDIGYYAVDTMVKILNGEEVEEFVDTGAEIITKDNAQAQIDKLEGYLK